MQVENRNPCTLRAKRTRVEIAMSASGPCPCSHSPRLKSSGRAAGVSLTTSRSRGALHGVARAAVRADVLGLAQLVAQVRRFLVVLGLDRGGEPLAQVCHDVSARLGRGSAAGEPAAMARRVVHALE